MKILDALHQPTKLRRFHAVATLVWLALVIPTVLWLRESILWISLMSIWACVTGHWSSWQAARAETAQREDN